MKISLLALTLICHTALFAQEPKVVLVKAGKSVKDYLSNEEIFYYPNFKKGTVFFKDGTKGGSKLNYNLLMDEINFIDSKGDTVAIADDMKETISAISIDKDSFYFNQGYVRLLTGSNSMKLAVRQVWTTGQRKKSGIYNSSHLSSATVSLGSYFTLGKGHDLVSNEDVEIIKVTNYYIGDQHNRFVLAGKKNLMKVFPKDEDRIEKYLKENKVNFSNKEDLQKMVDFLNQS